MKLMNFQLDALKKLMLAMTEYKKEIVLKAPTGSGKTIIMTHFMDEYIKSNPNTVFMWLTPGKGDLEEQSKRKMDLYIHNSRTKLLADVMTSGFDANDCCFINWEKLTKKGNNALKDGEFAGNNAYTPRTGYAKDEVFQYNKDTKKLMSELWIKVKASK